VDSRKATAAPAGSTRDPEFLRAARPILERYASYFRPEVRGFERLPQRGPFLVVGNHSGGQTPPDLPVLLTAWWRERGEDAYHVMMTGEAVEVFSGEVEVSDGELVPVVA